MTIVLGRRFVARAVVLALAFFGPGALRAEVVPLSLSELADRCEHAIAGTVVAVGARWNDDGSNIVTDIEIQVEEDFKGNFVEKSGLLTLTELGGTVGDTTILVTDTPHFNVGERVLVFTERTPDGRSIVLGRRHAKFTLSPAPGIELDEAANRLDSGRVAESGTISNVGTGRNLVNEVRQLMAHSESVGIAVADPPETALSDGLFAADGLTYEGCAPVLVAEYALGAGGPREERSVTPGAVYSNVTTFSGSGVACGGVATSGTNRVTKLLADDILCTTGGVPIIQFSFSVANFNTAAYSCQPLVRFYSDNANTPGTYLGGFNFNAISFPAQSVGVYTFAVPVASQFNIPANGKLWIGTAFLTTSGTTAQRNNVGVGLYNPVDVGSSIDEDYLSTANGGTNNTAFTSSNPAGTVTTAPYSGVAARHGYEVVYGFCSAWATTCDEYIGRVQVGSIDNVTACTSGGYADYSALSTNMTIGTGYPITITNGHGYAQDQCYIWIDWNHTYNFTDTGEQIVPTGSPGVGPYSTTITPPAGAVAGATRMRIRIVYNATPAPCGGVTYGETEDYTITVAGACTTPGTPTANAPGGVTSTHADFSWSAGSPAGSPTVTYYWAVGTAPGVTYEAGYTARGTTTGTTAFTDALSGSTTYYFVVKACTNCNSTCSAYSIATSFMTPVGLNITSVSPNHAPAGVGSAGPAGSLITIAGTAFGTKGANDHVAFFSYQDPNSVDQYVYNDSFIVSWTDTQITCFVAADASSQDVAIYKNGAWSNYYTFGVDWSHWFRWKDQSSMPLGYYVNINAEPGVVLASVQASPQTWEDVSGDYLDHTYLGTTTRTGATHTDGFRDIAWQSTWTYGTGVIAQTSVTMNNGVIAETDMEVNGQNFTWSSTGEAGKMDVQNIVTHEGGHGWVGLSDLYGTADNAKTMYGLSATGETFKRSLEPDDIAGCQWMYTGYCPGWATTYDEYISRVQVGTIDNSTSHTAGGYAGYTAQSTNVTIGTGYPITVTNGLAYTGDQCGIWVDWNQDADFSDANETITVSGGPTTFTATVTPPAGTTTGNTRLRVRILYDGTFGPCGEAVYGEVEDYTVNVQSAAPANPPNPTVSQQNCGNTVIQHTGSPPGGVTWYWQGTACGTNTGLGSGATYSATSSGTYYLRARNDSTLTWSAGCGSVAVIVDLAAPTYTPPADLAGPTAVYADADSAAGCTTTLTLAEIGQPTNVVDDHGTPSVTWMRSDSAGTLDAPFAVGTTTITWTIGDGCNSTQHVQSIEVRPYNRLWLSAELLSVTADTTRCLTLEFHDCSGGTQTVTSTIAFVDGMASAVALDVPCGDYDCIVVRDARHTLARRIDRGAGLVTSSGDYVGTLTGAGGLISGEFNADGWIDIIDFGIYANRWDVNYGTPNTTCATPPYHVDLNGNGIADTGDFTFIRTNFWLTGDTDCCTTLRDGDGPRAAVHVSELASLGLAELVRTDLNGDGWIDATDIALFAAGVRPPPAEPLVRPRATVLPQMER